MNYTKTFLMLITVLNLNAAELMECKTEEDKEKGCIEINRDGGTVYKSIETPYVNGKKNGLSKLYLTDGTYSEVLYQNGVRHGTSKAFFPNGKLEYQGEYSHGKAIKSIFYYIDGSLRFELFYNDNKIISGKCGDGTEISHAKITEKNPNYNNFCRKQDLENMKKNGGYNTEMGIDAYNKKDYETALSFWENGCNQNEAKSCLHLGIFYSDKEDFKKAFTFHKKSCELKNADACASLGMAYSLGNGVKQDTTKGLSLLTESCKNGSFAACAFIEGIKAMTEEQTHIDNLIAQGIESAKNNNYKKAKEIFSELCEKNNDKGCLLLGSIYNDEKKYTEAYKLYQKSCDLGSELGCTYLANLFFYGKGINENPFKAVRLYKKACEKNIGNACLMLGVAYADGTGIKQDYKKAISFLTKSCSLNESVGCFALGKFYEDGTGTRRDLEKSKEYYGKSCDLENNDGCKNYARINKQKNLIR